MHYVRGNLLVLIFAGDLTECERGFGLERQRNQIALLYLSCESPDLTQSGNDLLFTFARICLLIEWPQFVLCAEGRVVRKFVPRMTDKALLDGCLLLLTTPACADDPKRHFK